MSARGLFSLRFIFAFSMLAVWLAAGGRLSAQVKFEVRGEGGVSGQKIQAGLNQDMKPGVYVQNPAGSPIQGFQMAITHDSQFLDFTTATWKGTGLETPSLRNNVGPEFFKFQETTIGGNGITLGCVFELQTSTFVLATGDTKVATLTYKPIKLTGAGVSTRIDFATQPLGDPPITNGYQDRDRPSEGVLAATTGGVDVEVGSEAAYAVHFRDATLSANSGSELTAALMITNGPIGVDGFSFGVKHDPAGLELVDATVSEAFKALLGSTGDDQQFQVINKTPRGEGSGFTVAMLLSASDGSKVLDPALSPLHIIDAKYLVKAGGGATTNVEITGDLGQPKVEVLFDIGGTVQRPRVPAANPPPVRLAVTVTGTTTGAPFLRGDLDQNHRVNITDAIGLLRFLFEAESLQAVFKNTADNCPIAFNINGDTNGSGEEEAVKVDISDTVALFSYLFQHGPKPAEPFGDGRSCGAFAGKVVEAFRCRSYSCP